MIYGDYEKILNVMSKASGVTVGDLERKIEEKRSKLAGLISKEGAAQVVAAELGISVEDEKLKIDELASGMRKVNLIGQVIDISPVRTFMRKGTEGKVVNLIVADDTSNIKIVLWDLNHISLIEKGEIVLDKVIEILNGTMRDDEIHLGSYSELKLSKDVFETIQREKVVKEKNIADFRTADNISTRAFVVQAFEPRFFEVCPECKRKPNLEGESSVCATHGKIVPERRALINLVLDDGTETIRTVLFHDSLSEIGLNDLEDAEKLIEQRQNLIGKEMLFSGNVRTNKMFNNPEFVINNVKELELDGLISSLEQ
jgi:hypothetical protein